MITIDQVTFKRPFGICNVNAMSFEAGKNVEEIVLLESGLIKFTRGNVCDFRHVSETKYCRKLLEKKAPPARKTSRGKSSNFATDQAMAAKIEAEERAIAKKQETSTLAARQYHKICQACGREFMANGPGTKQCDDCKE